MLGHDLSSNEHTSNPSLTSPTGARSLTSSSPRCAPATKQREDRQQYGTRQISRRATGMRQESTQSYIKSSPVSLVPDTYNTTHLPVCTVPLPSMPPLAQTTPTSIMPSCPRSYNSSIDDQHHEHSHQMYPDGYTQVM